MTKVVAKHAEIGKRKLILYIWVVVEGGIENHKAVGGDVTEQLNVLVTKSLFSRKVAIADRNIPTANMAKVERLGG